MAKNQNKQIFGIAPSKVTSNEVVSKVSTYRGMTFPMGSRRETGGIASSNSGRETIKNAISQLLKTEKGERVMNPDFGCNLRRFLFQPLIENVFNQIKLEVATAFNRYILGASIVKLSVFSLNEYGPSGGNSLKIVLNYELSEEEGVVQEVEVIVK